jgi:amino acid transporter
MTRYTPPKAITWWISLVLCILAVLMALGFVSIHVLGIYTAWVPIAGLVLMLVATRLRGL